jgi:hypothetical protein
MSDNLPSPVVKALLVAIMLRDLMFHSCIGDEVRIGSGRVIPGGRSRDQVGALKGRDLKHGLHPEQCIALSGDWRIKGGLPIRGGSGLIHNLEPDRKMATLAAGRRQRTSIAAPKQS